MKKKSAIPLPEKRVSIKKSGNYRYVYYVQSYYVTKNGTRTHKDVAIGKLNEEDPTTFFPNQNYFELFTSSQPSEPEESSFKRAGFTCFLRELSKHLSLDSILCQVFEDAGEEILSLAYYMLAQGNTMTYLDDYYETHYNPHLCSPSEKKLGKLYALIEKGKRWSFFDLWRQATVREGDYVAYDVTSISTYGQDIELAGRGYNRDHENLPQVNVGVFYSQSAQLPIFYELYDGNIPDKTHLVDMIQLAEKLEGKLVTIVMDKGFLTSDNINFMMAHDIPFLMAFPQSQKLYRSWLLEYGQEVEQFAHYMGDLHCFGTQGPLTINDWELTGSIYLDMDKRGVDIVSLDSELNQREETLQAQVHKKMRKKKDPYFEVKVSDEKYITGYERKEESVNEAFKLCGLFGLLTNVADLDAEEALKMYRRRDVVESHYDSMKNQLEFYRLKTHHQQSTEAKFFIGFIAEIILAHIYRMFQTCELLPVRTFKSLVIELDKIYRIERSDGQVRANCLNRKQKDILELFDIEAEGFIRSICE